MKKFALSLVFLVQLTLSFAQNENQPSDHIALYSQLIDPFFVHQNPCDNIRNGGFFCKDCGTLSYCLQENGKWVTADVAECKVEHNLFCDENARGCVFKTSCTESLTGPKFQCQHPGIYPDPYDCKYYHVCDNSNEGSRFRCPSGTAYSPANKTCSITPNTDICLKPQYECTKLGQMGAWPTDPSIYYVCHATQINGETVRYPLLYQCPNGHVFVDAKCVLYTSSTTPPPTAPTAKPEIQTCTPGSPLKSNPYDCYSYFNCVNGLWVSILCPPGTHYSDATKSCTFGTC
ncbi:uncharacterized protein ACRADG_002318 [Cochliomyia hominivorax]